MPENGKEERTFGKRHAELHAVMWRLKGTVNVVSLCYDIYNVQATLSAVFLLAAAQAFGTTSLI
jgi:hypothetical protein